MDQVDIIRGLSVWLEGHLDQPLSFDNVVVRAGYSKQHLQRMFKDVTSRITGTYIRARRLSKSAVALRLVARPILDIVPQYRFDPQQTFTRAFEKQFSQTPALYHRSLERGAFGIRPPMRLGGFTMPVHEFVTLEDTQLLGTTRSYSCSLEQISDLCHKMRIQFQRDLFARAPAVSSVLYGLNEIRPSIERDDEQEVFHTTVLTSEQVNGYVPSAQPILLQGGKYVMFTHKGLGTGVQELILTVYGTCTPMLDLTRRKGQDIERYYLAEDAEAGDHPVNLHYKFLVLIRH